jgi:hypothetical protein
MTTAFQKAYEQAIKINPRQAARNCGFDLEGSDTKGNFLFNFLNRKARLEFPQFKGSFTDDGQELDRFIVTIAMYNLGVSDGQSLTNKWISYANLPGGQQYVVTMRNYTGKILVGHFANNLDGLLSSAKAFGATSANIAGDLSLQFQILPKVLIALIYWKGDDEFSPRANFLFDESAPHHLPSDCYAILCSWITSSLVKAKN